MTLEEALEQVRLLTAERDAANAQLTAITKERDTVRGKLAQATTDLQVAQSESAANAERVAAEHAAAVAALNEQHTAALTAATTGATRDLVAAEAKALAATLGMRDPSDAVRLLDLSSFSRGEDGSITGLSEAVTGLRESKAYLFGAPGAPASTSAAPPAAAPPASATGGAAFNAVTATDQERRARAAQLGINPANI